MLSRIFGPRSVAKPEQMKRPKAPLEGKRIEDLDWKTDMSGPTVRLDKRGLKDLIRGDEMDPLGMGYGDSENEMMSLKSITSKDFVVLRVGNENTVTVFPTELLTDGFKGNPYTGQDFKHGELYHIEKHKGTSVLVPLTAQELKAVRDGNEGRKFEAGINAWAHPSAEAFDDDASSVHSEPLGPPPGFGIVDVSGSIPKDQDVKGDVNLEFDENDSDVSDLYEVNEPQRQPVDIDNITSDNELRQALGFFNPDARPDPKVAADLIFDNASELGIDVGSLFKEMIATEVCNEDYIHSIVMNALGFPEDMPSPSYRHAAVVIDAYAKGTGNEPINMLNEMRGSGFNPVYVDSIQERMGL